MQVGLGKGGKSDFPTSKISTGDRNSYSLQVYPIALAVNRRDGSYGTAGTRRAFGRIGEEQEISDLEISATINKAFRYGGCEFSDSL